MKKLALLLVAIVVAVVLVKSRTSRIDLKKEKPRSEVASVSGRKPALPGGQSVQAEHRSTFLDHELVARLRAALESRDPAAIEKAMAELAAFIAAHPEMTAEYLEALRLEPDEHVLRGLSKAMQHSEALMANEAFLKDIVDLAQQGGFEQRQHILLDTLAQAAFIKPELFDAIKKMAEATDQPSEVRASAVAVYADWMQRFPEKSGMMIDELGKAVNGTTDEHVRAMSIQLLSLHRDKLPEQVQRDLADRLKVEREPAGQNVIAAALSAAPPAIRADAITYLQSQYNAQGDPAQQRLLLAQMVMVSPMEMRPMLEQIARGNGELADDAREYLVLVNTQPITPEMIMNSLVILAGNDPAHEHTAGCKH